MTMTRSRRRAGLLVPLFSCPSTTSWGVGDIGDLAAPGRLAGGCRPAGAATAAPSTRSRRASSHRIRRSARWPSTRSTSGCPACQISWPLVARRHLGLTDRAVLADLRRVAGCRLRVCSRGEEPSADCGLRVVPRSRVVARDRSCRRLRSVSSGRRRGGSTITPSFRAIHASCEERPWTDWPDALARRDPSALGAARTELARGAPVPAVPAVGRRRAVAAGTRGRDPPRGRALRRSAVHGRRRQRRRLGTCQ